HAKHAALELVFNEEMDVGLALAHCLEPPAVLQETKRSINIAHINDALFRLQDHLTCKRFAKRLVADSHVGHEDGYAITLLAGANGERFAPGQKFRIGFHCRDKVEHLCGRVIDPADRLVFRHRTSRHRARSKAGGAGGTKPDRKSTRLNSSHVKISYAVFC